MPHALHPPSALRQYPASHLHSVLPTLGTPLAQVQVVALAVLLKPVPHRLQVVPLSQKPALQAHAVLSALGAPFAHVQVSEPGLLERPSPHISQLCVAVEPVVHKAHALRVVQIGEAVVAGARRRASAACEQTQTARNTALCLGVEPVILDALAHTVVGARRPVGACARG